MAIFGQFHLMDYTYDGGFWKLHFVNHDPGGGNPNDYYCSISDQELTDTMPPNQVRALVKERLGWALNQTFAPLNEMIAAGVPVVLP